MTPSGNEPATFRLVAQFPQVNKSNTKLTFKTLLYGYKYRYTVINIAIWL